MAIGNNNNVDEFILGQFMDLDAAQRPLEFCALSSQLTEQLAAVIYRPSGDHRGRLRRHQSCGP